jgi:hypothetical protein
LIQLSKGIKLRSCDVIELQSRLYGRVLPLRKIDENSLGMLKANGQAASGERKIILTPSFPIRNVFRGDIISIPWGVRPNTWLPPGLPAGLGPYIWIETPNGPERLEWDGTQYTGNTINLQFNGTQWCLTGAVDFCFDEFDGCSEVEFPDGYSFIRSSGPYAHFEIIRFDEQQDDYGRTAFYTLSVESLDQKDVYLQE